MVSLEITQTTHKPLEPNCSPRISFSADFLDEKNYISITPSSQINREIEKEKSERGEFEFLSSNMNPQTMTTADELIFEGKLLPFWQISQTEKKLSKISLKSDIIDNSTNKKEGKEKEEVNKEEIKVNWFIDDDPSPRPPKCTVLWKELLRLKKQRASTLSPSSSTSSSSSLGDLPSIDEGKERKGNREKHVKRIVKGLDRTRSSSIRIRPVVNVVPICTQGKSNGLPPLFSLKKGRLER